VQYLKPLSSIGDAAIIQSYLRNSLKGIVSSKLELCTNACANQLCSRSGTSSRTLLALKANQLGRAAYECSGSEKILNAGAVSTFHAQLSMRCSRVASVDVTLSW
jgi:hypothetical protein